MPETLTEERLREIEARTETAWAMVHALCQPRGTQGSREWVMSIPARPDADPDLVIGAALSDVTSLLKALRAERDRAERAEARIRALEDEINNTVF